jgi:hypothetical protein
MGSIYHNDALLACNWFFRTVVLKCIINSLSWTFAKEVIRIVKLKKDKQHNGQRKKDKQRSTKNAHKTKDRVTRTPLWQQCAIGEFFF